MNTRKPVADLRPIDDSLFEKLMEDKKVCEEMLQTILEDKYLEVISLVKQDSIRNLQGKSVRLDALCRVKDGRHINIEVQRSDGGNHLKRVRYNASCITANITEPGESYEKVPDVTVVYISQNDFFRHGRVIYHVNNYIKETGEAIQDGLNSIYVNTQSKDGSDISDLMQCFLQKKVNNPKFPHLVNRVSYFKETEGGIREMCSVVEEFAKEYAKEYAQECNDVLLVDILENCARNNGITLEEACKFIHIDYDKYLSAKKVKENRQTED